MKLTNKVNECEMRKKIVNLLNDVGLGLAMNTLIGNASSKKILSGGEKKRLSFATEVNELIFINSMPA